ncbi:hypothetical protein [Parasphingorhabdus sp.]|uniref:hypothetical protein n=1 Tax=Parasphingorhabdus sp. TaxID=2709688 RepID=UPI003BB169C8
MLRRFIAIFLLIAAAAPGVLFWQRQSLPYNEEGRYFDLAQGVVYEAQAVTAYGVTTVVLIILGLIVLAIGRRPDE